MKTAKSATERQKAYVSKLAKSNFKYGLTVGTAFVRGIRDIGYKHTGTALDELIDNAAQAGAENIHVVFGYEGANSDKKPAQIAVIDDGCGMIPEMIRVAILWGGTDRENDRTGFGRFGYGMPSSCVSQGRRFEVYSITEDGKWHMGALDLDDIENGKYTSEAGEIIVPEARPATLPRFVQEHIREHLPNGELQHGTVVVIDKLDKTSWATTNALQDHLLRHFGVTYHKLRSEFDLWVNDKRVEPIDPLFLTPGYRWYDLDADRAQAFDPMRIAVKDKQTREVIGHINVRFSYMSPRFASRDKTKKADGKNANERFQILKEYNGFIVCRMGRVVEVVRHSPITTFMNYDRYIKIELDFDATLDEEFNVPTAKQRVDVSDRIWEILKEHGIEKALEQLRKKFREEKSSLQSQGEENEKQRPSEKAMEHASELDAAVPYEVGNKQMEEARTRLRQAAEKRSVETGKSVEQAEREIEAELEGKLYKVGFRSVPGGNFFEVEQLGGTKVLWINTASRFFQEVHSGPNSSPDVRAALEVLLFSIGDRILEGKDNLKSFYAHEVPKWSQKLEFALSQLAQGVGVETHDDVVEESETTDV